MNFITDLPESDSYNVIMVVIDTLMKMRHLIATIKEVDAKEVACVYINNVWKLHRLPEIILSGRGIQFTSKFWRHSVMTWKFLLVILLYSILK